MEFEKLIQRLTDFGEVLPTVVAHVFDDDARWKPPSGAWSILEIVCHLVDEEVEDFRARLKLTLADPAQAWPAIDPEGAAKARAYNERNLAEQVRRFVNERQASVAWLRCLTRPDWNSSHQHPKWGPITAGMLMAGWAAHDMLHLRQLAKRQYELAALDGIPFVTDYAGQWGP